VDPSELLGGQTHVEGEEDVSLQAADTLDHQRGDVPVPTMLTQQRSCMEQASHHVIRDRDRPQRGIHGPALQRCSGRRPEQQFGSPGEDGRVDVIAQDPPQRPDTTQLPSGDRRFGRGRVPHLRDVTGDLAGSEVVEERVHDLRRDEPEGRRPSGEVGVPVVGEPQSEHRLVGFVGRVGDGTDRLDQLEHPACRRAHRRSVLHFGVVLSEVRAETHRNGG
jgi:hypothetical protein